MEIVKITANKMAAVSCFYAVPVFRKAPPPMKTCWSLSLRSSTVLENYPQFWSRPKQANTNVSGYGLDWKWAFWACFRENDRFHAQNWVYKFGHREYLFPVFNTVSLQCRSNWARGSMSPLSSGYSISWLDCHTLGTIIWGGGGQGGDVILDPLICTVLEPKNNNQGLIQVMEKVYSYVHMQSDFILVFIKLLYKFLCSLIS